MKNFIIENYDPSKSIPDGWCKIKITKALAKSIKNHIGEILPIRWIIFKHTDEYAAKLQKEHERRQIVIQEMKQFIDYPVITY